MYEVTKLPPNEYGHVYESYRNRTFHIFEWEKDGEGYRRGEWGANVYAPGSIYPIAYGFRGEPNEDSMRDVVTEFINKIAWEIA